MKDLNVTYTRDFGRDAFYPDDRDGIVLALRMNRKSFSARTLRELSKCYRIQITGSFYPVPEEFKRYEKKTVATK